LLGHVPVVIGEYFLVGFHCDQTAIEQDGLVAGRKNYDRRVHGHVKFNAVNEGELFGGVVVFGSGVFALFLGFFLCLLFELFLKPFGYGTTHELHQILLCKHKKTISAKNCGLDE